MIESFIAYFLGVMIGRYWFPRDIARQARHDAQMWEAVARNIAASHPESVEVFRRVAAAHGLEVTK